MKSRIEPEKTSLMMFVYLIWMEIKGFGPLELILGRQDSHFRTYPSQMTLIRAIKPKGDLIASVQSVFYCPVCVIKTFSKVLIII